MIGEIDAYPESVTHEEGSALDTFSPCWMLNAEFQGKGYAYEAAHAFLDYLFRQKGARRIYAYVEDYNLPSQHLCEKLGGFSYVLGELRKKIGEQQTDILMNDAVNLCNELCEKYKGLPKKEKIHTERMIFPRAALYLQMIQYIPREEALSICSFSRQCRTGRSRGISSYLHVLSFKRAEHRKINRGSGYGRVIKPEEGQTGKSKFVVVSSDL